MCRFDKGATSPYLPRLPPPHLPRPWCHRLNNKIVSLFGVISIVVFMEESRRITRELHKYSAPPPQPTALSFGTACTSALRHGRQDGLLLLSTIT